MVTTIEEIFVGSLKNFDFYIEGDQKSREGLK
jgi:hypothetical protein